MWFKIGNVMSFGDSTSSELRMLIFGMNTKAVMDTLKRPFIFRLIGCTDAKQFCVHVCVSLYVTFLKLLILYVCVI